VLPIPSAARHPPPATASSLSRGREVHARVTTRRARRRPADKRRLCAPRAPARGPDQRRRRRTCARVYVVRMGSRRRRHHHHGRWVVPSVAPAAAAFAAAGLLLLVVAFHCFLSLPLSDASGGSRVFRRPNPPFLVHFLPPILGRRCSSVHQGSSNPARRRFRYAPCFLTRCSCFSVPPFCFSEQLNKPADVRRNVIGAVDFAVPVSAEFRVRFFHPFFARGN
jgi:hypothetical protein